MFGEMSCEAHDVWLSVLWRDMSLHLKVFRVYLGKGQVTHKGDRMKKIERVSCTPVHKALSVSSTYSLKQVFINGKSQGFSGK